MNHKAIPYKVNFGSQNHLFIINNAKAFFQKTTQIHQSVGTLD